MAWDNGDVFSIDLKQSYLGSDMINKIFYRIVSQVGPIIIEELLNAIAVILVDAFTQLQVDQLNHTEQVFQNVSNNVDFHISTYTKAGDVLSVDVAPSFMAVGFRKNVTTRLTRPGQMRLSGLNEDISVGNNINPAALPALGLLGVALSTDINVVDSGGGSMLVEPVVIGKIPGTSDYDLARVQRPSSFAPISITTQNSRKV